MSGRVHVETDHVFDLFGEFWIIGALERPQGHCHVWMAPADQGLFCGGAFDRGCGHVFGLSMRVLTPGWP
jgi:hypothetical protein